MTLPCYDYYGFLVNSGAVLVTIQDDKMLEELIENKRKGICGRKVDRFVNSKENSISNSNSNNNSNGNYQSNSSNISNSANCDLRSNWYIDANNLCCLALMQKLLYKDFVFTAASLDAILNKDDDFNYGY